MVNIKSKPTLANVYNQRFSDLAKRSFIVIYVCCCNSITKEEEKYVTNTYFSLAIFVLWVAVLWLDKRMVQRQGKG